jgi:hypothetical protein
MLQPKENCGLPYIITLANRLKYTCLNINNVNVNENMVLYLFYLYLSTAVYVTSVR